MFNQLYINVQLNKIKLKILIYFKEKKENNIYTDKNKIEGVSLCIYGDNINIIHAIGPDFRDLTGNNYISGITTIPEKNKKVKALLLIIYKSVFKEVKKNSNFKTVIMVPISGNIFASEALKKFKLNEADADTNTVNLIIHLTPEVIYEALFEVYNANDEIPDIKLLVFNKNFEHLKKIYGNNIDIS